MYTPHINTRINTEPTFVSSPAGVRRDFDKLMANRSNEAPPPIGNGSVAVECNGYAAGRGSGWVSFQGSSRGKVEGEQEGHHKVRAVAVVRVLVLFSLPP